MGSGNEIAVIEPNGSTAVAQPIDLPLDRERVELIKRTIAEGATDDELELFIAQCKRTRLDPFARQIYAVKRYSSEQKRKVMQTQVSIDGFRIIAERTGRYAGQIGPLWCGTDGEWVDVWLDADPPSAAKVGALRRDFTETVWGVALFREYAVTKNDGDLTKMWREKPAVMIAKCAESLALRKAFPHELSGLYTGDEMRDDDTPPPKKEMATAGQVDEIRTLLQAPLITDEERARFDGALSKGVSAGRAEEALAWLGKTIAERDAEPQPDEAA